MIADLISQYTTQQSARSAALTDKLTNLGQMVSRSMEQKAEQEQAMSILPALQERYKSAMGKIQAGKVSDGYIDAMSAQLEFGSIPNPLIQFANKQFLAATEMAGQARQSEAWRELQTLRAAGGAGGAGGTTLPAMLDDEELPGWEDDGDINQPVSEMEKVGGPVNVSDYIAKLSKDEKNPQWKTALQEARDLATSTDQAKVEFRNEIQKQVKDYNKLAEQDQLNRLQSRTFNVDQVGEKFVKRVPGSERVVGPGVVGILFNPKSIKTGTTIGQSGKPSAAYKKENIDTLFNQFNGSVSKLNEGEYGDFFEKAGGVFNTQLREDSFVAKDGTTIELPFEDRDASSMRTAYEQLKKMPGAFNAFDVSDAGFAYKRKQLAEGPRKEKAAGMAQLPTAPTQQRRPINSFFGAK